MKWKIEQITKKTNCVSTKTWISLFSEWSRSLCKSPLVSNSSNIPRIIYQKQKRRFFLADRTRTLFSRFLSRFYFFHFSQDSCFFGQTDNKIFQLWNTCIAEWIFYLVSPWVTFLFQFYHEVRPHYISA